jgi:hypothetical protein
MAPPYRVLPPRQLNLAPGIYAPQSYAHLPSQFQYSFLDLHGIQQHGLFKHMIDSGIGTVPMET